MVLGVSGGVLDKTHPRQSFPSSGSSPWRLVVEVSWTACRENGWRRRALYEYALRLGLKATTVCPLDWRRERGSVKVVAIASALLQLGRRWLWRPKGSNYQSTTYCVLQGQV
jgi:hypothetical protein